MVASRKIIAYCSLATSQSCRNALGTYPWRWILGPYAPWGWQNKINNIPFYRNAGFALDNGAWSCFQKGIPFQEQLFIECLEEYGERADWIVVPDCVGNKARTLEMLRSWAPRLEKYRQLIAVQDGMSALDIACYLEGGAGIFVGGSTDWKLEKLAYWGDVARSYGVMLHCGRVNTMKRIKLCIDNGYTSFDGSGVSRFASHARKISSYLNQLDNQLQLWR